MDERRCDIFLGGPSGSVLCRFFEMDLICLSILIILISLTSRTVLVPSLAARDALEICEMLAALLPEPVRYWLIQTRSRAMVAVLMMSSQK